MGKIGKFGTVTFEVKRDGAKTKARSFSDLRSSMSINFGEHPRYKNTPYIEYDSIAVRTYSMVVKVSAQYGFSPEKTRLALWNYAKKGTPQYLVVGGRNVCANKLAIADMETDYNIITPKGGWQEMTISLTFKEYIEEKKKKKKTKKKTTKKTKKKKKSKSVKNTGSTTHVVKSGETLWSIAKKYYGDGKKYTKIYNANKKTVKNPNKLTAGMKLKIPK